MRNVVSRFIGIVNRESVDAPSIDEIKQLRFDQSSI